MSFGRALAHFHPTSILSPHLHLYSPSPLSPVIISNQIIMLSSGEWNVLHYYITLHSFATDASSKLHVLWHYCHALAMNCARICILEQPNKVVLGGLLEGENGRALEADIFLNFLCYLSHEALKGCLTNEEIGRLLVSANLAEGNGTRTIAVRFLHASTGGDRLARCLGGKLLAGSFASS